MNITLIFLVVTIGLIILLSGQAISKPTKLAIKFAANSALGMLILWLFNFAGSYLNITIPLNLFTIVVAGFLGVPGLAMLGVLELIVK